MWVTCAGGPEKLRVRLAASETGHSLPFPRVPLWERSPLRDGDMSCSHTSGMRPQGWRSPGVVHGDTLVSTQGDGEGPSRLRGGWCPVLTPPSASRKPCTTRQPSCVALLPGIAGTRDKYIFSLPCREVFFRHPSLAPLCPVLLPPLRRHCRGAMCCIMCEPTRAFGPGGVVMGCVSRDVLYGLR